MGWCATKGKPLIPPKSIQVVYGLDSLNTRANLTNCCIVRRSTKIVALSGKVPWLEGVPCEKTDWRTHSPHSVLQGLISALYSELILMKSLEPSVASILTIISVFSPSQVVWESVSSCFKKGMKLEVVDKMRISQVSSYESPTPGLNIYRAMILNEME